MNKKDRSTIINNLIKSNGQQCAPTESSCKSCPIKEYIIDNFDIPSTENMHHKCFEFIR